MAASAPATMPMHVADRLLARFRAKHVPGLDVHQQVRGVARDLGGHDSPSSGSAPACAASIAPTMNCGIFDSEPDGVIAGERRAARCDQREQEYQRNRRRRRASQRTPNQTCAIQTPTRADQRHADHRDLAAAARCPPARRRAPGPRPRRMRHPRNAWTNTSGRANKRHHGCHHHHRDAPPERPGVEDVRASEDRGAFRDRPGARHDLDPR